jgi:hypothetical protein
MSPALDAAIRAEARAAAREEVRMRWQSLEAGELAAGQSSFGRARHELQDSSLSALTPREEAAVLLRIVETAWREGGPARARAVLDVCFRGESRVSQALLIALQEEQQGRSGGHGRGNAFGRVENGRGNAAGRGEGRGDAEIGGEAHGEAEVGGKAQGEVEVGGEAQGQAGVGGEAQGEAEVGGAAQGQAETGGAPGTPPAGAQPNVGTQPAPSGPAGTGAPAPVGVAPVAQAPESGAERPTQAPEAKNRPGLVRSPAPQASAEQPGGAAGAQTPVTRETGAEAQRRELPFTGGDVPLIVFAGAAALAAGALLRRSARAAR